VYNTDDDYTSQPGATQRAGRRPGRLPRLAAWLLGFVIATLAILGWLTLLSAAPAR
jgi:hypothetical protein